MEAHEIVKDARVFELGAGTGIVSIVMALLGAKSVFCTDLNEEILDCAKSNLKLNISDDSIRQRVVLVPHKWGTTVSHFFSSRPAVPLTVDVATRQSTGHDGTFTFKLAVCPIVSTEDHDEFPIEPHETKESHSSNLASPSTATVHDKDEEKSPSSVLPQAGTFEPVERLDFILGSELVYQEECFEPLVASLVALSDPRTIVVLTLRIRWSPYLRIFDLLEKHFHVTRIPRDRYHHAFQKSDILLLKLQKRQLLLAS